MVCGEDCGAALEITASCFCPRAIGLGRKLIVMISVIEQQRLHSPRCRSFRDSSGSSGLPSIMPLGATGSLRPKP
jgi:hypothetical protein